MTSNFWILSNVRPWGGELSDIVIKDTVIHKVESAGSAIGLAQSGAHMVDGKGFLALPGFINAHSHVDKSWWGQKWISHGGDASTQGRIEHERTNRKQFGIPSAVSVEAVLREFIRHGTTATRSHVDVDLSIGLSGIECVLEAVQRLNGAIEVELVAFPQDGVMRRPGVLKLLEDAISMGVKNIGGLDPAEIDREPVAQLDGIFEIAERTGVGLDIHLHDRNDLGRFQIELIVERTLATGSQGRVTISHGFALADVLGDKQKALMEKLAQAGISWTTVAPANSTPLPWRAMRNADIALGLGTDGIRDLWSPFGDGDLLRVALGFARLHGLCSDEDLTRVVSLATSEAAPFVHRINHDLEVGSKADIVLVDAQNVPDALVLSPRRELVVAGGVTVVRDGELQI